MRRSLRCRCETVRPEGNKGLPRFFITRSSSSAWLPEREARRQDARRKARLVHSMRLCSQLSRPDLSRPTSASASSPPSPSFDASHSCHSRAWNESVGQTGDARAKAGMRKAQRKRGSRISSYKPMPVSLLFEWPPIVASAAHAKRDRRSVG